MRSDRWASLILLAVPFGPPMEAHAQTRPDPAPRLRSRIVVEVVTAAGAPYGRDFTAELVDEARAPQRSEDGSLVFVGLRPGLQSVRLSGLDPNCRATGTNPRLVTVPESGSDIVRFEVACDSVVTQPPPPPLPPPLPPAARVSPEWSTIALGDSVRVTFWAERVRAGSITAERARPGSSDPDEDVLVRFGGFEGEPRPDSTFEATLVAWPATTTTYVFRVTGGDSQQASARGTVYVPPPPVARLSSFVDGDSVVIRLEAERAESVSLRSDSDPPVQAEFVASPVDVLRDSTVVDSPRSTTTVMATARGPGGVDTTSTAVAVVRDTLVQVDTVSGLSFRPGLSAVGLVAGAARFAVPTLSASATWGNWVVELRGGLRPKGAAGPDPISPLDPRPEFGERTQKLVSASILYFPDTWRDGDTSWGAALSYFAGWEMVRELDYFMTRAHGPAVGPRVGTRRGRWNLMVGVDLQYAQVEVFDDPVARWEFGVTPSITFAYVFERDGT
ncbi:MAG TPA: hypothetical protein VLA09_12925 [Longimicrobiales bacterium]|nr:hypothetical protein [Longimicrobiales bacterium]